MPPPPADSRLRGTETYCHSLTTVGWGPTSSPNEAILSIFQPAEVCKRLFPTPNWRGHCGTGRRRRPWIGIPLELLPAGGFRGRRAGKVPFRSAIFSRPLNSWPCIIGVRRASNPHPPLLRKVSPPTTHHHKPRSAQDPFTFWPGAHGLRRTQAYFARYLAATIPSWSVRIATSFLRLVGSSCTPRKKKIKDGAGSTRLVVRAGGGNPHYSNS